MKTEKHSLYTKKHSPKFTYQHTVTAEEIDFLGHVNNKVYLHWMEMVAWEHAKSVGINHAMQKKLNRIMAVYENQMQYKASCYSGDQLKIITWIAEPQGCCLRARYFEMIRSADKKLVFSAKATYVCIALDNHKPKRIPAEFSLPYFDN